MLAAAVLAAGCADAAPTVVSTATPRAATTPATSRSLSAATASPSPSPSAAVTLDDLLFAADGDERRVKVYVPDPPPTRRVPLVLYFHPAGGTPSSSVLETRFDDLAGRKGFIVAFPQSAGSYWDVAVTEGTTDSDIDERYVAALVDKLIADLPIDPDRVFVTGFSMGAVMADRVACRLTDRIKAASDLVGNLVGRGTVQALPADLRHDRPRVGGRQHRFRTRPPRSRTRNGALATDARAQGLPSRSATARRYAERADAAAMPVSNSSPSRAAATAGSETPTRRR